MSAPSSGKQQPALLNALLGMALVVAAGLNIVLLAEIGWATWQRAGLAEHWQKLRLDVSSAEQEAEALREAVTGANLGAAGLQEGLANDADVARFVAGIPATAAAWGVSVTQLNPQATTDPRVGHRSFVLRAQGPEAALQSFLAGLAETAPSGAHIEAVSLQLAGDPCVLELTLVIPIRQASP